ncbi:DUF2231 domain-containing protein [Curtobacterium sp. ISL-83]|uniref:DUF2231 domain-containing protein n=1 Tax=Curtobacterium sp. ISL-83 TaxID=2819145 RepID=UPI001BE58E91|nr:DUF2231 domain-containing protein [Curtobacterium sp. ISL-83]MBT2503175.1 hypothetical protein [Curtobacterium sp. ISL-83]
MNWQLGGLPLHPLLVHLTAVAVPVAALTAVVVALWPAARRWLAVGSPIIGLVALVSVPLATSSGEWLEARSHESAALQRHTDLADGLLPWMGVLFALMVVWWAWHRFGVAAVRGAGLRRAVGIAVPVLLVVTAIGAGVDVVLIGHAGAVSVWSHGG